MVDTTPKVDPRKVFVIHGRNEPARKATFEFLRAIGLYPIEWSQALELSGSASPYIGEVLTAAFGAAQAIVVLQTPDDVAHLHESLTTPDDPEIQPQMQPRPNVLFEAGMAMGRDADRTVIVELGKVKSFSDIHGRHTVRLDNSLAKRQDLANRLRIAGCAIDLSGSDWHSAGDLTPPATPGNGLPLGRKLPSSTATGRPRLAARLNARGGNRMSDIVVTNHGPGDVYNLDAHPDAEDSPGMYRDAGELPVPRLPAGKSVVVLQRLPSTYDSHHRGYFNITLSCTTADGTPIEQNEFISGA